MTTFLHNRQIYEEVIQGLIPEAAEYIWIATADIKDMHVSDHGNFRPFLGILSDLVGRGVGIRLLHAKEPGENFRRDFDCYPNLIQGLERNICPRVHLKTIVVDGRAAYLGSANLTGAGMGAKSANRRNFESGILTRDPQLLAGIMNQFDEIWMGARCDACQRRSFCADPIA
ncbi:phospholipase D-like domain-containing protein [Pontiella agarivorans]|uniref:Phospholipase D-like domain-containing protein n=1 Tax=Pontiella agarivorans TaxID=3038953 RepID=A0ABU5MV63_9BACT|nr:phospholipase D-like domain-containing protein [Pontiella agarivorans]MDZ8118092.1 phospholipase D-like domain-containing protein [Pontiella agarivorans]